MSFRQYGGMQYAPRHNMVSSNTSNAAVLQVTTGVGQANSYINFFSDISGNVVFPFDVDISGNLLVGGDVGVGGDVDISGNLVVGGDLIVDENFFAGETVVYNTQENVNTDGQILSLVTIISWLDTSVSGAITVSLPAGTFTGQIKILGYTNGTSAVTITGPFINAPSITMTTGSQTLSLLWTGVYWITTGVYNWLETGGNVNFASPVVPGWSLTGAIDTVYTTAPAYSATMIGYNFSDSFAIFGPFTGTNVNLASVYLEPGSYIFNATVTATSGSAATLNGVLELSILPGFTFVTPTFYSAFPLPFSEYSTGSYMSSGALSQSFAVSTGDNYTLFINGNTGGMATLSFLSGFYSFTKIA